MDSGQTSDALRRGPSSAAGLGNFTFLEQALWKRFRDARTPDEFSQAWLGLLCRMIGEQASGVLVLGEPEVGPFAPAAYWPDEASCGPALSASAERAMQERQGVVLGPGEETGQAAMVGAALPIVIDEQLFGVVAVSLGDATVNMRDVMRHLQWSVGWMEVLLRREQSEQDEGQRECITAAFDMVATCLEHERFQDTCNALVTELASRLDCDPVSIGVVRRGRTVIGSVSHAAQFAHRTNLLRDIAHAMDEAIDQEAVVVYPVREGWDYRITRAHAELANSHQAGSILTVPLQAHGKTFGALSFERPTGEFDEAAVALCDGVASVIGPILEEKRRNDRLILVKVVESVWTQLKRLLGPRYFGRKLATFIAALIVTFFALVTDQYRVTSPAVLEGRVQRSIVVPVDGYLASQHARAGEIVKEGQVLATLDDKDAVLERIRWNTKRRQSIAEYDQALARQERAEANIVRTQIEQAEAQVALLDAQLSRMQIKAPFDGVVVSGDLSQAVGSTLERGQELFKVAPLNAHRVMLEVDEADIKDIKMGQSGKLLLTSLPSEPMDYMVERITPVAGQADGRNYFHVEASLSGANESVRPGMEGIAKTEIEDRLLIWIWTEKLVNWARLSLWAWLP